ncbi:hypothetical protein PV328_005730 [Microctonus aethiopoides]|uniref:Protein SMG7-like n=1 Tax=Microctonus aethiopoides TaxID=144406 RepID=A0AA39FMS3_9HYME|nr:hypothetical protein PV328_005730 [Microctonus aethiopoides]
MGLNAAVQALKKAEPLKDRVQQCKDLLNDNNAWIWQQQLQKIYQQVLILDLEYALDKKVEQELWNFGFKNYIAILQNELKNRKNENRGEFQAMLNWLLEAASGFYLTLLQEICSAFDLDLLSRRKGYVYGLTSSWSSIIGDQKRSQQQQQQQQQHSQLMLTPPHKSSCYYVCQYCLVHLGDIARYRNENRQAELFYRHAVSLAPSSGQPYNQLALLEASRGDKLGTVFYYVRSVAVKHPFPVALANLAKTLSLPSSSIANDDEVNGRFDNNLGTSKLNSSEYINIFLKFHGAIHNYNEFDKDLIMAADKYIKLLTESNLTALVATGNLSSWRLVQMFIVNLYGIYNLIGNSCVMEQLKSEELDKGDKMALNNILDVIAGSLSALLLPVYTLKGKIIEYFALPAIKLCLEWMQLQGWRVLESKAFVSRLQIWPSLCALLNGLHDENVVETNYNELMKVALPEDCDVEGFSPLEKSLDGLKFGQLDITLEMKQLNELRALRILNLGRNLTLYLNSFIKIIGHKFTCTIEGLIDNEQLIKELEQLNVKNYEEEIRDNVLEKKVLSLPSTSRKCRQNIAMQAIMRRAETEHEQSTFDEVSVNSKKINCETSVIDDDYDNNDDDNDEYIIGNDKESWWPTTNFCSESPIMVECKREEYPNMNTWNVADPLQIGTIGGRLRWGDGIVRDNCNVLFDKQEDKPMVANVGNVYSLFSENSIDGNGGSNSNQQQQQSQQSLWCGPGPSPLERLLEQQKSSRESGI